MGSSLIVNLAHCQTAFKNITPQELPALSCNFTRRFSMSKSQMSSMLTFSQPFGTFKLTAGYLPCGQDNFCVIACIML